MDSSFKQEQENKQEYEEKISKASKTWKAKAKA
jgi:hypothetical protein